MNIAGFVFFFQAEDGIRDKLETGVQTCALPILAASCAAHTYPSSLCTRTLLCTTDVTTVANLGGPASGIYHSESICTIKTKEEVSSTTLTKAWRNRAA